MDPITYNKTFSKLTKLDPKYEHIRQDPYLKKVLSTITISNHFSMQII